MTSRPLHILIICSDATRASVLEEGLRASGDAVLHLIRETANLPTRVAAIEADVIFIDLADPTPLELEQVFAISRAAKRPIAMFVEKSDRVTVATAIDAGITTFVVDRARKERIASILDVTIARFQAQSRMQNELQEAKLALEERKIVERAKAILMKQRNLSEGEAYGMLRRTAMNQNRKIVDLARSLLAASQLLGAEKVNE